MTKPKERMVEDWIEGFVEYTKVVPSPEIFRRWAAYSTIAGALERRAWTRLSGSTLYPNLFILLIGPPGVGKGMAINVTLEFWTETGKFNLAPAGMTKAFFVDQLGVKMRQFNHEGKVQYYNPMLIGAPEFGTLLPSYDLTFLNVLNDVYDCRPIFEDGTRGTGGIKIDRPHVNLLGGTQPKYLGEILPESAYGMGFCSRIIMVYAGERIITKMFKNKNRDKALHDKLLIDLKEVANLCGEFEWEQRAQDAVEDWNESVLDDGPKHSLLQHYNSRRVIHTVKLAMTLSAARSSSMVVTYEDFIDTKNHLIEVEEWMPEVFKEMTSSSDSNEMEEVHRFAFHYCKKYNVDKVPEHKIIHFMSKRIPVNKTTFFIDTLVNAKLLEVAGVNLGSGKRMFRPRSVSVYDK